MNRSGFIKVSKNMVMNMRHVTKIGIFDDVKGKCAEIHFNKSRYDGFLGSFLFVQGDAKDNIEYIYEKEDPAEFSRLQRFISSQEYVNDILDDEEIRKEDEELDRYYDNNDGLPP